MKRIHLLLALAFVLNSAAYAFISQDVPQSSGVTTATQAVSLGGAIVRGLFGGSTQPLVDSPSDLEKAATDKVIEAALSKPDSPWAWQALEKRTLTPSEVAKIMDGLATWVKKKNAEENSGPLHWVNTFLDKLNEKKLVTDEQVVRFVEAVHGDVRCEYTSPTLRLREGAKTVNFPSMKWRDTWSQKLFGLSLMNELRGVTVDGQALERKQQNSNPDWSAHNLYFSQDFSLPTLAPGKHNVKVEVLSALVPEGDLIGLEHSAPSSDWPPAKKLWTRTAELELMVYARDAVIVTLTEEAQLNPVTSGCIKVESAVIRPRGAKAQVVVKLAQPRNLPVAISCDAALRIGGQTYPCGQMFAYPIGKNGMSWSGETLTATLPAFDPSIQEADVVLTPNPKFIEEKSAVDRIWGKEIVFERVPLKRLDIMESPSPR